MYDYDDYEDEDLSFIHDEDSDHPNSICDWEPELEPEDKYVRDLIDDAISELDKAVSRPWTKQTLTITRETALTTLQLLKAFSSLYTLSYDEYCIEYD